jgi:hypothetical protein
MRPSDRSNDLDANEENTVWLKKPSSLLNLNVGVGDWGNSDYSHPLGTSQAEINIRFQTMGRRALAS